MSYRRLLWAMAMAGAAAMTCSAVKAGDGPRYPEWKGAWERWVPAVSVVSPSGLRTPGGQPSFDQTKPWGRGQQAPLTAEYQKVLEDSIADQAAGGQGNNFDRARCMPTGMPHMMTFGPLEFVVTADTTYILIGTQVRRIFTDGRDWPREIDPSYAGYSVLASTTPPAFLFTSTISPFSRSASISINRIPTSSTTRSPSSTMH